MVHFAIPTAVLLVVALRSLALSHAVPSPPPLPHFVDRNQIEMLRARPGITRVEFQRFDRRAVLAVGAGPDGRPGVAGTDDNINGVTDDRLELGATRSDDPCLVLTADQLAELPHDQVLVLQRGAFVDATSTADDGGPARAFVYGKFADGRPWSALVDLDNLDDR